MKAVIVADVISSTSLPVEQLVALQDELKRYAEENKKRLKEDDHVFWGRVVRGDTLECYMDHAHYALRLVLLLKLRMMQYATFQICSKDRKANQKLMKSAIRVALGVGKMRVVDTEKGILDGEAVYLAGRELDGQHSSGKEKVSLKRTLFYAESNYHKSRSLSLLLECIDVFLRKATDNQLQVIYYKLLGKKEAEIALLLKKSISTINERSVSSGWNVISNIVNYYEKELYPL